MRLGLLILTFAACVCSFAQQVAPRSAAAPRIVVELPDNVPSDTVWIRYSLTGTGSTGATVKQERNLRQYVIEAVIEGNPAQHAKVVVYAPGCQFKAYTISFNGTSDVTEQFRCDSLPTKKVIGFLPPAQIPEPLLAQETKLAVVGELEPDWVCRFFLLQKQGATVTMSGSCLSAGVPLGRVGVLDLAKGGNFEIAIPDFTHDPLFRGTEEVPNLGNFGEIQFAIHDNVILEKSLAGLRVENSGQPTGLSIEETYATPTRFTTSR